jgi:hypothetical protein
MNNIRAILPFGIACCLAGSANAQADTGFPTKLFLSTDGLALSSFPSRHVLSKTIKVERTQGKRSVSWTASSDQSWLTVTPSGQTGGALTVKAKPGKLQKDQLNCANVTVATSGGDFSDTETLRVGFWIGSTDTATVTVQQDAIAIAANPVEPVAYVADGSSSIYEYNVYSGQLVGTLEKVAPTIGPMEVSSDGQTLFATDTTNYKIVALDADTGDEIGTYSLGYALPYGFNMVYARPYGQPAIYAQDGPILAVPSGDVLANGLPEDFLAVTPDGRKLFGVDVGTSPGTLYNYSIKGSGGKLDITPITSGRTNDDNCQDLAVSLDGRHVYPACGAPYEFDVYDGKTLEQVQTLPANPYPNNVKIDVNDDVVGGIDGLYEQDDIYVFNQKGYSLGEVPTSQQSYSDGQQTAAMGVSGDAMRVISVTAQVYNSS